MCWLLREKQGEECLINDQAFMLGLTSITGFVESRTLIAAMLIDSDSMQLISLFNYINKQYIIIVRPLSWWLRFRIQKLSTASKSFFICFTSSSLFPGFLDTLSTITQIQLFACVCSKNFVTTQNYMCA